MCLVSRHENCGIINTKIFIPHVVHEAIGVLAVVSVATACVIPDTVTKGIANYSIQKSEKSVLLSIENPSESLL